MAQQTSRLKWTDWLLLGGPLIVAGALILLVVVVLGWTAQPGSPWGRTLAAFFISNPYSAIILIIVGVPLVGKALIEYKRQ